MRNTVSHIYYLFGHKNENNFLSVFNTHLILHTHSICKHFQFNPLKITSNLAVTIDKQVNKIHFQTFFHDGYVHYQNSTFFTFVIHVHHDLQLVLDLY